MLIIHNIDKKIKAFNKNTTIYYKTIFDKIAIKKESDVKTFID
jgi:hypothetical protein